MSELKYRFKFPWGQEETLSLEEIVKNAAENIMGLEQNYYYDGDRENPISLEEFQQEVYNACMLDRLELDLNGSIVDIDTPKEIRFYGEKGIKAMAKEIYERW